MHGYGGGYGHGRESLLSQHLLFAQPVGKTGGTLVSQFVKQLVRPASQALSLSVN